MTKQPRATYCGSELFDVDFNLYNAGEWLDHDATKDAIAYAFLKKYWRALKSRLDAIGCRYISMQWYRPKAYNFEGDSLDMTIAIRDKKTLLRNINKHKDAIESALSKNRSYDGYMATTSYNIETEFDKAHKADYTPDIIVLRVLLNKLNTATFDPTDQFIFDTDAQEEYEKAEYKRYELSKLEARK